MTALHQILSDQVARHMRTDPTRIKTVQTVAQALEYVRGRPLGGRVVYFYIVDEEDRLQGVIPTRRLLMAPPDSLVTNIMVKPVVAIPETATGLDACEFFILHRLLAFPVVDTGGRLIGLVDVDQYTEQLSGLDRRQESDDLFQLIGVHVTEAEQKYATRAFRKRFPWLLCNVAGGMVAALLADAFEKVATLALVAPFIALVTALAEGVSIQSVSLALLTLHGRPQSWAALARKVGREVLVGILLGASCGVVVGLLALVWKGSVRVGLSLCLGIAGGVAASAVVGLVLPYVLKLLRRDPQVASGPIALAASDVVTLVLYFNLGRWLLL